jgi:hypothetical protein
MSRSEQIQVDIRRLERMSDRKIRLGVSARQITRIQTRIRMLQERLDREDRT